MRATLTAALNRRGIASARDSRNADDENESSEDHCRKEVRGESTPDVLTLTYLRVQWRPAHAAPPNGGFLIDNRES